MCSSPFLPPSLLASFTFFSFLRFLTGTFAPAATHSLKCPGLRAKLGCLQRAGPRGSLGVSVTFSSTGERAEKAPRRPAEGLIRYQKASANPRFFQTLGRNRLPRIPVADTKSQGEWGVRVHDRGGTPLTCPCTYKSHYIGTQNTFKRYL